MTTSLFRFNYRAVLPNRMNIMNMYKAFYKHFPQLDNEVMFNLTGWNLLERMVHIRPRVQCDE